MFSFKGVSDALAGAGASLAATAGAAAAAASTAVANAMVAGIVVRNESDVPLLVVCSQLTPLHWAKVMPGEVFNEHNKLGMGKVWFTVSCSPFDPKNEPTVEGVAASIASIAVGTPLILPAIAYGGAFAALGGAAIAAGAAAGMGGLAVGGAVIGAAGAAAVAGGATGAAAIITRAKSIVGVKRDGVYSDGSTLVVRGRLNDAGAYALFYADEAELRERPYAGAPSAEESAAFALAIAAAQAETSRAAAFAAATPEARSRQLVISTTTTGIQVKNECAVPLLIIASQLTPIYWGRVEPGEVWNLGNEKGMGAVWFTVSAQLYDARDVPTTAGVAVRLAASTALFVGGPITFAIGGLVAAGGAAAAASSVTSVRGATVTGVYANGRLLTVRGATGGAAGAGAYALHFATPEELAASPWSGPPAPEQLRELQRALDARAAARAARADAGAGAGAGADAGAGAVAAAPEAATGPAPAAEAAAETAAEEASEEAEGDEEAFVDFELRSVGPGPEGLAFTRAGDAALGARPMPAFSDCVVLSPGKDAAAVPAGASLTAANGQVVAGMPFAEAHALAQAALAARCEATPAVLRFRFVERAELAV